MILQFRFDCQGLRPVPINWENLSQELSLFVNFALQGDLKVASLALKEATS